MKIIQMHAKLLIWKQWSQPTLQLDYLKVTVAAIFYPCKAKFEQKAWKQANMSRTKKYFNAPQNYLSRLVNLNAMKIRKAL